jgi:hypothetical protein
MKKLLLPLLLFCCCSSGYSQTNNISSLIDSLQYMKADTIDCRAGLFWRIVGNGEKAIPSLINHLTDTTPTLVRHHCKKTTLNVAEVCQAALEHIASFPAFMVTHIQFDVITLDKTGKPCWTFLDFLFDNANKPRYQKNVRDWWEKERGNYKVIHIRDIDQTPCMKENGINTIMRWVENNDE